MSGMIKAIVPAVAIGIATILGAAAWAQGKYKITPGLWENRTEVIDMKMEGLPANVSPQVLQRMRPATVNTQHCVTPEEAANPKASMLANQGQAKCDIKRYSMAGGKLDIAMSCTNPQRGGTMTMTMAGTYSASAYAMNGSMNMAGGNGMKMAMKTRTTGRRIGNCKS